MGGYWYGEKKWEEAPKEFLARAKVTFKVRDPFVSGQAGLQIPSSEVADANELEVLDAIKSEQFLSVIIADLGLTESFGMSLAETVSQLRIFLELDLDQDTEELEVMLRLTDPQLAADVANAVANAIPAKIKELDEAKKNAELALLQDEAQPVLDRQRESLQALEDALKAQGVTIKVEPGMDLTVYLNDPDILAAKLAWDAAREDAQTLLANQSDYRTYWNRAIVPSVVVEKAEVPQRAVGPPVEPFQVRWATWGTTVGLILGSLLMLVCWKLFP